MGSIQIIDHTIGNRNSVRESETPESNETLIWTGFCPATPFSTLGYSQNYSIAKPFTFFNFIIWHDEQGFD